MAGDDCRSTDPGPAFDPETGAHHVRCEPSDPTSLASAVVATAAAVADVPETDLDDRLYDHVDPDALTALIEPTGEQRRPGPAGAWLTLAARRVVVRASGDTGIYSPEPGSPTRRLGRDPEP